MMGFMSFLSSMNPWQSKSDKPGKLAERMGLSPSWDKSDLQGLDKAFDPLAGETPAGEVDAFLHFGEWLKVQSSNVEQMRYLADESALEIQFKNGNFYRVDDMSIQEAKALATASSVGSRYWDIVRVRGKGNFWATRKPYTFMSGASQGREPQWMRSPKVRRIHALVTGKGLMGTAIRKPKVLGKSISHILAPKWGGQSR